LLDRLAAGGAQPETRLSDAVTLSHIWASMAALRRRAGEEAASALEKQRLDLWRQWDRKLPDNAFIRRQIAGMAAK
jgi:hypothetical protein